MIQFATTGSDDWQWRMLENGLFWLVGVEGWVYAVGHLFFADQVADSIGWGAGGPFQFEVGLANLSYGVLGVFASAHGRVWWLATVVAFSVFYLGRRSDTSGISSWRATSRRATLGQSCSSTSRCRCS